MKVTLLHLKNKKYLYKSRACVDAYVYVCTQNYYGTAAVQNAIDTCKIISDSKVLDVGSGLGGPARYMASKTGCHVVAIEIQPDCSEKAKEYTERCNLSENISHSCLNVITIFFEFVISNVGKSPNRIAKNKKLSQTSDIESEASGSKESISCS